MGTKPATDYPKMAVAALIQRASDVTVACCRDKKELCRAGLDWKDVTLLRGLLVKCADKEAEYQYKKEHDREVTAKMRERMAQCEKLRDQTARSVRRAFLSIDIAPEMPVFLRKRGGAEIVQDLSDIAVFCRMNAANLKRARFDFKLADEAAQTSKNLALELAEARYDKTTPSELVEKRNRICRELYNLAVEVCDKGRKVFKDEPLRKNAYRSIKKA
jgi:hypothetical protein